MSDGIHLFNENHSIYFNGFQMFVSLEDAAGEEDLFQKGHRLRP